MSEHFKFPGTAFQGFPSAIHQTRVVMDMFVKRKPCAHLWNANSDIDGIWTENWICWAMLHSVNTLNYCHRKINILSHVASNRLQRWIFLCFWVHILAGWQTFHTQPHISDRWL
jgi:hypothetical protein